jgi:hypothetical protein
MKRTLFAVIALGACVFSAQAQYFTNGNLAVVRVGGAGQLVSTNGIAVHIDQFTTGGSLINTVDFPTVGNNAFMLDNSTAEGYMTLSENDQYLVLGGYNAGVGAGFGTDFGLNGTASSAISRSIATVDGYGNFVLQITNNLAFTTWPITSAVFDGTNNFWMEGEDSTNQYTGIVYVGSPSSPTTVEVANTGTEEGVMNLYNGSLFLGSSFSPNGIYQVLNTNVPAAPLPESANSVTNVIPLPSASRNKDFVLDPGMTTCYYADTSIGIVKYTNNAGAWVSNYTIPATNAGGFTTKGALGITADWTQSPVVVYATTAESSGNRLIELVDSGPTAVATLLAQAFTNHVDTTNVFRGVRFTPSNYAPMITAQPASVAESANATATFTVTAVGSATLSYQWYTNSVAVPGATTSSLAINNATTFENGTVLDVVVANGYGTVTSSNATLTVTPSFFTGGNLAVVRVGGAGQFVSSNGIAVHVDQFTTGGSIVNSVDLPTSGSNAFVLDNSTAEGYMTLSENNHYLVLGGYNTPVGSGFGTPFGLNGTASSAVSRSIATVDGYGNFVLQITNNLAFTTWPIESAVFDGTNNFWMEGESSTNEYTGIVYVGSPASPTTVEVANTGNEEAVMNLYNGSLFLGTSFAPNGIFQVLNTNVPAAPLPESTNSVKFVVTLPAASRNKDFVFDPGMTTCYYADSSIGIVKYVNSGGSWLSNYTISASTTGFTTKGALGITADWTQSPVVVYATTAESSGNRLIELVDSGPSAVPTMLAQALTNHLDTTNVFRGLRFVPGEAPSITNEPAPVVQAAGADATFTVGASGSPVFTYQWYTNGGAVAGATNSSFTLTSLTTNQNGTLVSAVVINDYGTAPSSSALLTVQLPNSPFDVTIVPPTSLTVSAGATATFTASSIGAGITYYWSLDGVQLTDGGAISGSSTATLVISPAYGSFDGTYTVIASNSFGIVPANNSATLTVIDPIITQQPAGSTNVPGASSMFSVTAVGTPTLTYQWLSNGVALTGANASTLTVANGGSIASASYSVIVSNGLGNAVTSAVTTVSFTPVLLSDTFSYPNGNLFGDPGSPWTDINGSNPELVTNGRVQISESNATTDAQSLFSIPESGTVVWASFILNLSVLPSNPGGVYFANLEDTNFGFYGRIFVLTSNQPGFTPNIPNQAFPGTYRLGIADAQNDSTPSASSGPNAVVPMDLAPGIDYEVVFYLDLVNDVSGMAINPAALSDVTAGAAGGVSSGPATDSFTPALPMAAFGLRQRVDSNPKGLGEGVMEMDNLLVSFDWQGPGSGYPVVTPGITASNPVIGLQPVGTTNDSGNSYTMEVAASGIGSPGVGLTYAWYQNGSELSDGGSVSGSTTQALTLNPLAATNDGTYYVVVTGTAGSTQSSNAVILVNVIATPPVFTIEPAADTTNSQGGTVTLDSFATGTGPITYQWYFSNTVGVAASQLSGDTNADLMLTGLTTNESGTYFVIATGDNGVFTTQSSNAALTVTGPKSVTIAYLRSLLNPETDEPSDTTTFYNITGVITTATNLTSGDTASYYMQDSTGGINLFVTFGSDFRPSLGDEVTATGQLYSYFGNLELDVSEGSTGFTNYVVGTNFPQPTPILLPWGNNTAPLSPFITTNVEGSVVMLTNLYFEAYTPGALFNTTNSPYTITNNTGETFLVYLSDYDTNYVAGKPIPPFATSIAGPLWQDDTTGLEVGIEFTVYSELVVPASLPPLTNTGSLGASFSSSAGTSNLVLSWTAVPSNYTYSVWATTNLLKPFSNLVSGLVFSNALGIYTNTSTTNTAEFFEISSP